jgi:hypothetical protein
LRDLVIKVQYTDGSRNQSVSKLQSKVIMLNKMF